MSQAWSDEAAEANRPIASTLHTVAILILLAAWSSSSVFRMGRMRVAANPNRILTYSVSLVFEWLVFALVLRGAPARIVLAERWASGREVVRDFAVAAGYWVVSGMLLVVLQRVLQIQTMGRNLEFLLPQGPVEVTLWVALSASAGICEEAIFRGYLQRQFAAWTKSAGIGVALSAAMFGAAHSYQGFRPAILIGCYGAMFGVLAEWRRSVRPGMMAHAWQDTFTGLAARALQHTAK